MTTQTIKLTDQLRLNFQVTKFEREIKLFYLPPQEGQLMIQGINSLVCMEKKFNDTQTKYITCSRKI